MLRTKACFIQTLCDHSVYRNPTQLRLSPLFHRNNNFFKVKLFSEYQQKANNGDSNILTSPIGKKQELELSFILLLKNNCLPVSHIVGNLCCDVQIRQSRLCNELKVISSTPPSQLTALSCYCLQLFLEHFPNTEQHYYYCTFPVFLDISFELIIIILNVLYKT